MVNQFAALQAISIALYIGGTFGTSSSFGRSLMTVGSLPDISAFPYAVYLVQCSPYVTALTNNCAYFCSANLGSPNVVTDTSACVSIGSASFAFDGSSGDYESFKLLSSTTDSDDAVRFALMNGNSVYVTVCTGTPCNSGLNLQTIARVYMDAVTGISSKSHYCTTCTAKQPIYTITAAGQHGGISLYDGLSLSSATLSNPASSSFVHSSGMILNLVAFDTPSMSSIESSNDFDLTRVPSVFQSTMLAMCASTTSTSTALVSSFLPAQYLYSMQCADPTSGASTPLGCVRDPYIPFTGPNNNQQDLFFNQAGTVALCSCSSLTVDQECSDPSLWAFDGLLYVAGPMGSQTWNIPVNTVFQVEVIGWGLGLGGLDFLRIIPSNVQCTDNSNNPESIFVKTGCPNCSSSTALPIDIPALALRTVDDVSLPRVVQIRVYQDHSIFSFSTSIADYLVSGDRIALNPSDLLVDGTTRANWDALSQNRAFAVAGIGRFADELTACYAGTDCDNLVSGHLVTVSADGMSVSVPVGLDEFESVVWDVAVGGANWSRHSRLTTSETLMGVLALANSKVCWGRENAAGTIMYYLQAGVINFVDPPAMYSATLVPVSQLAGVAQPMTLTVSPNYLRSAAYLAYGANSTVTLRFKFMDLDQVEIGAISDLAPGATLATLAQPNVRAANICGDLFSDFSTNHVDGFPQPQTCWYSDEFLDAGVRKRNVELQIAASLNAWQSLLSICTNSGNVHTACYYNFAFQAVLGPTYLAGNEVVHVETICPYCDGGDPYFTIESMPILAIANAVVLSGVDATIQSSLSFMSPDTDSTVLDVNLGIPELMAINPLYDESLQFGFIRTDSISGGIQPGNVLRLTLLPQLQWNITAGASCFATEGTYTLTCTIESQPGGQFRQNVIKLAIPLNVPTASIDSLVGPNIEYPVIFRVSIPGGLNWPAFVPTRMAIELFAEDLSQSLKSFTTSTTLLEAPTTIASTGRLVPIGDTGDGPRMFVAETDNLLSVQLQLSVTIVGPQNVSVLLPPDYRCAADGWLQVEEPNECLLQLEAGEMIVNGAWNAFEFDLVNPPTPLLRSNATNVWQVSIEAIQTWAPFSSGDAAYMANVAVISPLAFVSIEPNSFGANVQLYVYVQISEPLEPGTQIVVDAPFLFSSAVGLLPAVPGLLLLQSGDLTCAISSGSQIVLTVNRIIDTGDLVGFSLQGQYSVDTPTWSVYTTDSNNGPIEGGSPSQVVPHVCTVDLGGTTLLTVSSLLPFATSQAPAIVSLTSLPVDATVLTIRVTFPLSFSFYDDALGSFWFASESLPAPTVDPANVLVFSDLAFDSAIAVAFEAHIRVPSIESAMGLYAVFVEVWDDSGVCVAGAMLALPPIEVVRNVAVTSESPIAGIGNNVLRIVFTLTTELDDETNDYVEIAGDDISRHFLYNRFEDFLPSSNLPTGAWLEMESVPLESVIQFVLKAPSWTPNVAYWVDISVTNPELPMAVSGLYSVVTSRDAMMEQAGFPILSRLASFGFQSTTDDRPLKPNVVAFYLSVPQLYSPSDVMSISVVTPPMFLLSENCTADITVPDWQVLNCRAGQIADPAISGTVRITLSPASEPVTLGTMMYMSVGIVANPPIQPMANLDFWSIVIDNTFGSGALPDFPLFQFDLFTVEYVSTAFNSVYPVNLTFSPRHSLPVSDTGPLEIRSDDLGSLFGTLNYSINGGLVITAPVGMEWSVNAGDFDEFRNLNTWTKLDASEVYVNKTNNELLIVFIGNETLETEVFYSFVTNIVIASEPLLDESWFIGSFNGPNPVDELTIDDSEVIFDSPIGNFSISNTNYNRDTVVIAALSFNLGLDWPAGATVVLTSPYGFGLAASNGDCLPAVFSYAWTVACPTNDTLVITNVGTLALGNTFFTANISLANPHSMSTDVSQLFWGLQFAASSAVYLSWRVWPEIMDGTMEISGSRFAAGSLTNITISFVPASEANFLLLNITAPTGFNFSVAVSLNYTVLRQYTNLQCWGCLALNGLDLKPNLPISFEILNVLLGAGGGPTLFTLTSFDVPLTVKNPLLVPSTIRDQTQNISGFFLAGTLVWNYSIVDTGVPALPYVSIPLNPRIGIEAVLRFEYNVTLTLSGSDPTQPVRIRFELSSPGLDYLILPQWGNFSIEPSLGTLVSVPAIADNGCGIVAQYDTVMGAMVNMTTDYYNVSIPVVPQTFVNSSVWLLNIFANDTLLNGNDALTQTPSNVSSIPVNSLSSGFTVTLTSTTGDDGRSPASPGTQVDLQLRVSGPLPWGTNELLLMVPSAFTFMNVNTACLESSLWCASLTSLSNQVQIVPTVLAKEGSFDYGLLPLSVSLAVLTPTTIAECEGEWILVANQNNTILGWGSVPAIVVVPMPNVEVIYGGIANAQQEEFILNFQVAKNNTVNSLELVPPPGYTLYCSPETVTFIACTHESTLITGLLLNVTSGFNYTFLPTGFYTVPLLVSVPLLALSNSFDLIARDPYGVAMDGSYQVPGDAIQDSQTLDISNPTISLVNGVVTLSFTTGQATTAVDAVTIEFPANYYQSITSASEVGCVNRRFPYNPRDFVDLSSTQAVTFLVDNTTTSLINPSTGKPILLNQIPASQTIIFTFPIIVPASTPTVDDYWTLSFCQDRTQIAACLGGTALGQLPIYAAPVQAALTAVATNKGTSTMAWGPLLLVTLMIW